jgi:hypothetical protein
MTAATLSSAPTLPAMRTAQRVTQVGLFIIAFICFAGGTLQMVLGQPETTPRLDNVHRFLAGIYLSTGFIAFWAARTIREQGTLVYLLALGVFIAGMGRVVSITQVGLPSPAAVWLGYLIPELMLPLVIALSHRIATNQRAPG